jgi:lysophospholipase L1-like esterase
MKNLRIALGLGFLWASSFGCGPTATESQAKTANNSVNSTTIEPVIAKNPQEDVPKAGAPESANAGVLLSKSQEAAPELAADERFPSGLVVDVKELGGSGALPELPKDSRILHIGDSFAGALGIELNKVLKNAGVKARLEFETSTYIPTWAYQKKLKDLVSGYNPDLVLISLGANELENPEPEKRAPLIKKIVESLGGRSCVWVAPALWEGAKSALLDVIKANVEPCVYLDMNRLVKKMPRAGDKIHPSMATRPDWALATARWLANHRRPTDGRPWAIVAQP